MRGETLALFSGLVILALILLFATAISVGIVTFLIVAGTAIAVWIQQSQLLGGCARVSENQFPEIHALAIEAAARLAMRPPEVFIKQDPCLNAFAIGFLGRKSVVLHSTTVEAMDRTELEQIIGHEFSHIKCGHTNLIVLTSSFGVVNVPVISQVLGFIFLLWSRKAEYTCDRGGLLASRDPRSAIAAMCKLAVGPVLFKQMNVDDFMNQHAAVAGSEVARLSENLATHPYLVKRIRAIRQFHETDQYRGLAARVP